MILSLAFACLTPKNAPISEAPVQNLTETVVQETRQENIDLTGDGVGDVTNVLEAGLVIQKIDLNGDKTADITNHYKVRDDGSRILIYKTVDMNWDAKPDVFTWFDPTGEITKEAMDGDFDGIAEWVDHYKKNILVFSEIDTNFDGTYDLYRYYEHEKIKRKEYDTDGNGKIDYWQYFDDEGNVQKIGRDTDGDGEIDTRE